MVTPRGRATNLAIAVLLILGGLALAVANGSNPDYQVTQLAPSGSFFSLAMGGNIIYAASANSGSILLEKSMDRGLQWTTSSVPYSLIASNTSSWTHAAVAVDGQNVVVTASSGGPQDYYPATMAETNNCEQISTILLASSADEGATWHSQTFVTPNIGVSSLQVGIDGSSVAVAWLGSTSSCPATNSVVGAVASMDGGKTWSNIQDLTPADGTVSASQNLEMAASTQGIVVAFEETDTATSSNLLDFWLLDESGSSPYFHSIYGPLPAPSSWTLQGDSDTSAFLLTPTYLIQLGTGGLTGIPFSQLQEDSGNTGSLPRVVSLVPSSTSSGGDSVEVAATMPSGSGVDCWLINLVSGTISQTCHVPLDSFLLPSGESLPIVSLLYGDGWWVAVGAGETPYESSGGGGTVAEPTSSSVGTSVCFTGCGSNEGLVAYYFTQSSSVTTSYLAVIAVLIAGIGVIWLIVVFAARRSMRALARAENKDASPAERPSLGTVWVSRLSSAYLKGLLCWMIVWIPLFLLAFIPSSLGSDPVLPYAIIAGGVVGAIIAIPFHTRVRTALQSFLSGGSVRPEPLTFDRAHTVAYFAYASWFFAFLMLIAVGILAVSTSSSVAVTSGTTGTPVLSAAAILLVMLVVVVVCLRALYHNSMASALDDARRVYSQDNSPVQLLGGDSLRTKIGAALIPWNPLVGLILGWALQPITTWSPFVMAWIFLPVTLLGMALLGGYFGRTAWASPAWA
jgi:hypothetical protein